MPKSDDIIERSLGRNSPKNGSRRSSKDVLGWDSDSSPESDSFRRGSIRDRPSRRMSIRDRSFFTDALDDLEISIRKFEEESSVLLHDFVRSFFHNPCILFHRSAFLFQHTHERLEQSSDPGSWANGICIELIGFICMCCSISNSERVKIWKGTKIWGFPDIPRDAAQTWSLSLPDVVTFHPSRPQNVPLLIPYPWITVNCNFIAIEVTMSD